MSHLMRGFSLGAMLLLLHPGPGRAQAIPEPARAQAIPDLVARTYSSSASDRVEAFYELMGNRANVGDGLLSLLAEAPAQRDLIADALIELLRVENRRFSAGSRIPNEGEGNYYGDLIWAVSYLEDPRALAPLMAVLETGRLARLGVARIGPPAVDDLVQELGADRSNGRRESVAMALDELLKRHTLPSTSTARVKEALLRALDDSEGHLRAYVVRTLHHFPDPDIEPRMRALIDALKGPGHSGRADDKAREAAREWLRRHGG